MLSRNCDPSTCPFPVSYHFQYSATLYVPHSILIWGCCLYIIVFVLITGHFVAPFAAHAFCNHMGFPDFAEILTYREPQRIFLMSVLVLGLVAWCMLLTPLTNPAWYSNQLFWKNPWYLFNWVYINCVTPLDIIQSDRQHSVINVEGNKINFTAF